MHPSQRHFYQTNEPSVMKKCYPLFMAISMALLLAVPVKAQFTLNDSLTVEDLVLEFFDSGVLVEISNLTVNGVDPDTVFNQYGLFGNGLSDGLDFDEGLVMATTTSRNFLNLSTGFQLINGAITNDPDMMEVTGQNVNNCAIIEFDVLVEADALAFSYLFASTEYASFTCSSFNDAFAFFISGPGIEGDFSADAMNIATIPDSDTPVSINTVNSGVPSGGSGAFYCEEANPNWQNDTIYFLGNQANVNSSFMANGYTVELEAFVEVQFGETYHMKLAICDAADGALPSAVFLKAGSFEGRLLSTDTYQGVPALQVYPNPATDLLRIENPCADCSGFVEARITDLNGRVVASRSATNRQMMEIPVSQLAKGMYLVELREGNRVLGMSKFVKAEF